jgi:glycolate dehydrogenase FAD-binding subunit
MVATTKQQTETSTVTPTDQAGVVEAVRAADAAGEALFPSGGGTSLDYGAAPASTGQQLELSGLAKVVDYTPRDMTILVEAGVRMADLAATLAAEGQQLPVDVPRASEATIGGVVATNWAGPRRFGHGTIRDYVIGIHAVDGRGIAFKGGGRVVKNVAGYDFCKLLTGSLGTLGVVTQLALKVKPQPECTAVVVGECGALDVVETALSRLAMLQAPPAAIDLLIGDAWQSAIRNPQSEIQNRLAVRLEGTETEIDWLVDRVQAELRAADAQDARRLAADEAEAFWGRQVEFADRGAGESDDNSPLVVQAIVPPSAVTGFCAKLLNFEEHCAIQAHAASGVITARFAKFTAGHLTSVLSAQLRPAAVRLGGSLVVVRSKLDGLTPHLVWGGRTDAVALLERIKQKFDPKNILNPGRYIL